MNTSDVIPSDILVRDDTVTLHDQGEKFPASEKLRA